MSTASPARIAANKRNAALSTGPITPEGKAASRANSLKHGMTGAGVVVPDQDLARIAAIAQDIRDKHHPSTEIGLAMADRAAMLLVRLNRAGLHELAMIADQVSTAIHDFDQFRRDWADDLFDDLEANPAGIHELKRFPEGIDRLLTEWSSLDAIVDWSADDLVKLVRLSDAGGEDPTTLRRSIPDLVRNLNAARARIDVRPIERFRQQAADLALFSDSPEAILARKYEAATERAYHKAMKTLIEAESPEEVVLFPESPQTTTAPSPLGSFLPGPSSSPRSVINPEPDAVPVASKPPVDRVRRPDPKKLRETYRREHR